MGFSTPLAQYSLRRDSKGLFVPNCLHAGVFFRRVLSISLVAAEQRAEGWQKAICSPIPLPCMAWLVPQPEQILPNAPVESPLLKKTYASIAPQGTSRQRGKIDQKPRSDAICNLITYCSPYLVITAKRKLSHNWYPLLDVIPLIPISYMYVGPIFWKQT